MIFFFLLILAHAINTTMMRISSRLRIMNPSIDATISDTEDPAAAAGWLVRSSVGLGEDDSGLGEDGSGGSVKHNEVILSAIIVSVYLELG